jgi:hypothetical protein
MAEEEGTPVEKTVIHDGLTIFRFEGKTFKLRELKIKRAKELAELIAIRRTEFMELIKDIPTGEVLPEGGFKAANDTVAEMLNFLFDSTGEEKLTGDNWGDILSKRQLEMIIDEASKQSRLPWLPPFFMGFSQTATSPIELFPRTLPSSENTSPTIS